MSEITYLVIDLNTRTITVPSEEKTFGVYNDNGVARKYFMCPRYTNSNVDLSRCSVYVNYVSSSATIGRYLCKDVKILDTDDNYITFSWELTANVFDVNKDSTIRFSVKVFDNDTKVFNTASAIGKTKATIDADDVVLEYADVILTLISRFNEIEDVATRISNDTQNASYFANQASEHASNANLSLEEIRQIAQFLIELRDEVEEDRTEVAKLLDITETAKDESVSAASASKTSENEAKTAQSKAEDAKTEAELAKTEAVNANNDAQEAQRKAEQAQAETESLKELAESASTTAINAKNATESLKASAEAAKIAAEQSKTSAEQSASEAAKTLTAVNDAGTAQINAINQAGQTQTTNVNTAGANQVKAVEDAGASQIDKVTAEGRNQVEIVQNAGAEQVGNVDAKAEEYLSQIEQTTSEIVADREQITQNKSDIATLFSDVSTLAPGIICDAEGSHITLTDAADNRPVQEIALYGRSWQDSTTGAQLLDVSMLEIGAISAMGINFSSSSRIRTAEYIPVVPGEIYTISIPEGYSLVSSHLYDLDYNRINTFNSGVAIAENAVFMRFNVQRTDAADMTETDLEIMKTLTMLNKGSTALPWEPYTGGAPSPSIDYPQEIESAGDSGSVEVTSTGKNLIPSFIVGDVNADNGELTNSTNILRTDYIRLDITKKSFLSGLPIDYSSCVYYYDKNKVPIGRSGNNKRETLSVLSKLSLLYGDLTINDTEFIIIRLATNDQSVTASIQLEYGDTATSYEPYKSTTLSLLTPTGLPGIPVTSGGNVTIDGQQYVSDVVRVRADGTGEYEQRVKELDLANLTWSTWGVNYKKEGITGFYHDIADSVVGDVLCTIERSYDGIYGGNNVGAYVMTGSIPYIAVCVYNTYLADISDKTAAIQSFVGTLSQTNAKALTQIKPIITELSAAEVEQFLTTYSPTTIITNDADAQMEITYIADTKTYIDNKFAELATALIASAGTE